MEDGVDFAQLDLDAGERFRGCAPSSASRTFGLEPDPAAARAGRPHPPPRAPGGGLPRARGRAVAVRRGRGARARPGRARARRAERPPPARQPPPAAARAAGARRRDRARRAATARLRSWDDADAAPRRRRSRSGRRPGRTSRPDRSCGKVTHRLLGAPYSGAMPEGDTIHYAANRIRPVLEGRVPDEIAHAAAAPRARPLARAPARAAR